MPNLLINISDREEFTGLIKLNRLNEEEEIIPYNISEGLSVRNIIKKVENGKYSLGKFEINLDFDNNGELVQIEIYT